MRCSYLVCMMCMIWICYYLWSGLISFYVMMIFSVACHGGSNKCWSDDVVKCFCGGICNVIMNDLCMNYHDYYFNICESVTVIMACYTCVCPGGGVWRLIWYNALCVISCGMQVCLMVVFYLGNLLLCDHTHCIQNSIHQGSYVQCGPI